MSISLDQSSIFHPIGNGHDVKPHQRNRDRLSTYSTAKKLFSSLPIIDLEDKKIVKLIKATNGEEVSFTFLEKSCTIAVTILNRAGKPKTVNAENLPQELRQIPNSVAFSRFIDNVSVRIASLSKGENKIYLTGKLLGGNPYQAALEALKAHIGVLANPILVKTILTKFVQIAKDTLDSEEGIIKQFSEIMMPEETKKLLENYSDQIQAQLRSITDVTGLEKKVKELKKDLSQLVQSFPHAEDLWEPLEIFLSLPQIRGLDNESMRKIMLKIKTEKNHDTFARAISEVTSITVKRDAIDSELKKAEYKIEGEIKYPNLESLVRQIIRQKKTQKEGIATLLNRNENFFIDKTIYLRDPLAKVSCYGIIKEAKKKENYWFFKLNTKLTVIILHLDGTYKITVVEEFKYRFLKALNMDILSQGDVFELELPAYNSRSLIDAGQYKFIEYKEKSTSLNMLITEFNVSKYMQFEFHGVKEKYQLRFFSKEKDLKKPISAHLRKFDVKTLKFKDDGEYPLEELSKWMIIKKVTKPVLGINDQNADDLIHIREERDQFRLNRIYLQEIEKQLVELRNELAKPENDELLDELLDNYEKNNLEKIDVAVAKLRDQYFIARVNEIVQVFAEKLKVERKLDVLLKQIVEEANYSKLAAKEKSVSISKTMELLKDTYEHVSKMKDKDLILLVGKTGSGKSVATNYLLGVPLEVTKNYIGQSIVKIKEGITNLEEGEHAKIGQSLGESETIYVRGYALPTSLRNLNSTPLRIADCPGFEDTRDGDYEICTNISFDQTVTQCKTIRAIVLTIPIQAFAPDKGNQIIDLVETLQNRFPGTFDLNNPTESSNLFILITKSQQVDYDDSVAPILEGTFFGALCLETEQKMKALENRQKNGEVVNDFELSTLKRRNGIWQFLRKMHPNRIDLIDIADDTARNELLKKYCASKEISKNIYNPAMKEREMQSKFGKSIQMSAHTWTAMIQEYLERIPQEIDETTNQIKKIGTRLTNLNSDKETSLKQAEEDQNYATNLKNLIENLEKSRDNFVTNSNQLTREMQAIIRQATDERLAVLRNELSEKKRLELVASREIARLKQEEQGSRINKGILKGEIEKLEKRIKELSEGEIAIPLAELDYRKDKFVPIRTLKVGAKKEIFQQMREPKAEDFQGTLGHIDTDTYKGVLIHPELIEREYKIVPTDPIQRKDFEELGISGQYIATMEGENYALDLGRKAASNGKKIIYSFKTFWPGNGIIPWYKISHSVLKSDYYEASIIDQKSELEVLKRRQEENLLKHANMQKLIEQSEKGHQLMKERIDELDKQITHLKETLTQEEVEKLLETKKAELSKVKARILELKDLTLINSAAENGLEVKQMAEQNLNRLKKTKRNLAIVIKKQFRILKLLNGFADILTPDKKDEQIEIHELALETYNKFVKVYDRYFTRLEKECEIDLALEKTSLLGQKNNNNESAEPHQIPISFFNSFKQHIISLINPALAKQILEGLQAISQDVLDPEIGILHHFDNLDLSDETKEYLRNLNEQIQAAIRNSSDVGKTVEAIKRDLSLLAQHQVADQILEEKVELKN